MMKRHANGVLLMRFYLRLEARRTVLAMIFPDVPN